MRFLDEYRDADAAKRLADAIKATVTRPWTLMEICGGQTHSIVRFGIDQLLPNQIELVHGPGCPVCVTPIGKIDQAIALSHRPDTILTSFGDMLRVPGSQSDLLRARSEGANVRIVYSPLDAVELAAQNPDRQVVFFAVGFETTAPANALAVKTAFQRGLTNFSMLVAHVRVPPAMEAILGSPKCRVQGFLAAGHVCTVMGTQEYVEVAAKFKVPIVVTGFEPVDLLLGVLLCVKQLEEGRFEVENPYARAVRSGGNASALALMEDVYEVCDREWRGIGSLNASGLRLRDRYRDFDAEARFGPAPCFVALESPCRAAEVLQGLIKPHECPAFGAACTPDAPLGAPMVSSEGACAAYYRYRRKEAVSPVG